MVDLVVRSRRVFTPEGEQPAAVAVTDGRIVAIHPCDAEVPAAEDVDLGDDALLPGLVDTHVHVNEPGRTEWEGFATATRAAAAGGVTTIIDMPLNSLPPTVNAEALRIKQAAAAGQCHVDVGFWGGAIPGNAGDLPGLHAAGVFGFKAFLADSGVPEFPPVDAGQLAEAMGAVEALFVVHAEDPEHLRDAASSAAYTDFLDSRPAGAEHAAVATAIAVARETGRRVHILHLSAASALPLIAQARIDGVRVTAETCPHYLTLDAGEIPDGATEFKCCPPIRDAANADQLWAALADGLITCVVSDHSPCTPELKRRDTGDFAAAWGGIASVQLGLPVMWTAARERGHTLSDVVKWMAHRPADLAGLRQKGRIAVGADADLVAFRPDAEFTVDARALHHRNPLTPYAGRVVKGVVGTTWLRGSRVTGDAPGGRFLRRETAGATKEM
ncbi:putative allantoinase [Actinoplanes missouriensis 431]|uniref:allantoinase n=1 Tax=Actinoplanes missouriensis (strain ATCC 14538 / DSM 43046 / CBS 188.64 / JCM 3121 / NBRC 102363 / NCIMB 12654 / NRRL B-3342 / UNCC 431) TaxID=512565 RepID=I0HF06_ACTM4|nr:allantoinase AllB [Actinoplanes missouriensis]BAL91593.1 putative allantoinase [Actinoplanes missouriensis 431]